MILIRPSDSYGWIIVIPTGPYSGLIFESDDLEKNSIRYVSVNYIIPILEEIYGYKKM